MPGALLAICSLLLIAAWAPAASAQCPITSEVAAQIDFSEVAVSCRGLAASEDPVQDGSCDLCSCSLVDAFAPPLTDAGFDLEEAGGFAGAEMALRDCVGILAVPLAQAGVPLQSLLGLAECGYTREKYPDCIRAHILDVPSPQTPDEGCFCTMDLEPVCDHNGYWYTNLCVAGCRGAEEVEPCLPAFSEAMGREVPVGMGGEGGRLAWRAGCVCAQETGATRPVCDVGGRRYSSACIADCQGITTQFDCSKLVVDFKARMSSSNVIEEQDVGKRPIGKGIDNTSIRQPGSPGDAFDVPATTVSAGANPKDGGTSISPEVAAVLEQFGINVEQLPPGFTRVAFKIFNGEQVTDAELAGARALFADEEGMAAVREKMDPVYVQQLALFGASATGNNAVLLEELTEALSPRTSGEGEEDHGFQRCVAACKPANEVCSESTGEKYPSSCHARCSGATSIIACGGVATDGDRNGASATAIGAVVSMLSTLFAFFTLV